LGSDSVFKLVQLNTECTIDFQCGDEDLDDFFRADWFPHFNQLLSVTYCMYLGERVVAMVILYNDRIDAQTMLNSAKRLIPNRKRRRSYPAVKIGRLAVAKEFQGQRIGENLMDFLKAFFIIRNKTGCRYITVDAYPKASGFYERCGFKPLKPFESFGKRFIWKLHTLSRRWGIFKKPPGNILMYLDLHQTAKVLKNDPERRAIYHAQIKEMLN
jgi:GNAT superfamily N-acetyltransferase